MHTSAEWEQWYYLMYLLPGGAALILLLLSAAGGGHHGSAGHAHAGAHPHLPHLHLHSTHGTHHAAASAAGRHAHGDARAAGTSRDAVRSALLGVGRVPTPIVWGSFLLGWGFFGFWGTRLWEDALRHPALFVLPALLTALAGFVITMRFAAAVAAKLLPVEESTAISRIELCGYTGTVAYPVDREHGRVHIYDRYGTLHDMPAGTDAGQPPIARGAQVIVTDYDAARDRVIVEELQS